MAPVALFVDRYRAYAGVAGIISGLDIARLEWRPFEPVFYWSRVLRSSIVLAVFAAVAALIATTGGAAAIITWIVFGVIALLIVLQAVSVFLARPENGFAITEDALVVRQGFYHQRITAMPIARMENFSVTQPAWWKSRRAVRLTVQGMKNLIHIGAVSEAAIDELMVRWHAKIDSIENLRLYMMLAAEPSEAPLDSGVVTVGDFVGLGLGTAEQ